MFRANRNTLYKLALVVGLAAVGCGDDRSNTTCGEGTRLEGEVCVPTAPEIECGTGTVEQNGECVPDGSVICEQGTRFDTATGQCVVDPSACADGTVFVNGECVPEDETLTADVDEAAEPNDGTSAGTITIPAVGSMTSIHGCITPRSGQRDEDVWVMQATGPTALEITADGVGGLAAGFIVQDAGIAALPNYFRAGINLTGDTSRRQVFLPTAGTYVLVMDDSRAILVDEVAGSDTTCYFTTIERIALPAGTAITTPTQAGTDVGDLRVLTYTADAAGDIFRTVQTTTSESMTPAFVVMNGNTLLASAAPSTSGTTTVPPQYTDGGLNPGDVLTIVVDNQFNFSPNPTPYTFTSLDLSATALPADGSTVTVTGNRAGTDSTSDLTKFTYLYFDVPTAGAIWQWNLTSTTAVDMVIVRENLVTGTTLQTFAAIDSLGGTGATAINNQFTRFLNAGRYYFVIQNPAASATVGESIMITSTLTPITPTPVVYGTPLTAQALPASNTAFHTLDLTDPTWVEFGAQATNWGTGNVRIAAFDPAVEGVIGSAAYPAVFSNDQTAAGTAPFGRIMVGETRDFIIRVTSTSATVGTGATYDLNIRTRPHVALTAAIGTPIVRTGETLAFGSSSNTAQNVTRYLVTGPTGPAGITLTALVDPADNIDPLIIRRNADEGVSASTDAGGNGANETQISAIAAPPGNFVAFTVGAFGAAGSTSTFDLTLTVQPPPYSSTTGALAYTDICAGGTTVMTGQDDTLSASINLPAAFATFPFFGTATPGPIKISSNGFLTFNTAVTSSFFTNTNYPDSAAPNGLISPYHDDLVNSTVCTASTADTFTVQWDGNLFVVGGGGERVQFQAVLHTNGVIDFIYGPQHAATGATRSGATVGVENLTGTRAFVVLFNQAGLTPSTSRTLTPSS